MQSAPARRGASNSASGARNNQSQQWKEDLMNRVSLKWRFAAAVAAIGTTASVVWAMSDYAYPVEAQYEVGQMARTLHWSSCAS